MEEALLIIGKGINANLITSGRTSRNGINSWVLVYLGNNGIIMHIMITYNTYIVDIWAIKIASLQDKCLPSRNDYVVPFRHEKETKRQKGIERHISSETIR